jgi:hypothetical protein
MTRIQPLPHVLATFTRKFSSLVVPSQVNFEMLWGLVYLNLKVRDEVDLLRNEASG